VQSQLVTLADFPPGWSVDNSSSAGGGSLQGCDTSGFRASSKATEQAQAAFKMGAGVPSAEETIQVFSTSQTAGSVYAGTKQVVDACKTFTVSASGDSYNGTVNQESLGTSYGDQSGAYLFTVDEHGLKLGINLAAVLKGSEIMELAYASPRIPDVATFNTLVSEATAKLP
jgi:hypothetical protein